MVRGQEKGRCVSSRGGPILPRVDFEIQEGALEMAVGRVSAVWKD